MDVQLLPESPRPPASAGASGPSRPAPLPKRVALLFRDAAKGWIEDGASTRAAALSFYTLFSISPLLLVVIAVAGILYGRAAAEGEAMARLEQAMGPQAASAVATILENTSSMGKGLLATLAGLAGVLVGASGVFANLQDSLNRIWRVKPRSGGGLKGMLYDRTLSFSLVVGMGVLLFLSLAAATILAAVGETLARYLPFSGGVLQALNFAVSLAMTAFLFALLFRFLPDARVRWRDLWVGASATALLFSLGRWLIGLYLARGSVSSPYGAAGSLVVLLLWIYYSAQVIFFGAELTRVYAEKMGKGVEPRRGAGRLEPAA
jgi:membrane protein